MKNLRSVEYQPLTRRMAEVCEQFQQLLSGTFCIAVTRTPNGQKIIKRKFVKRRMYGRGRLDLLQAR